MMSEENTMKVYSSGLGTLNKYDMYEVYYKDQYNTNVDCIEAVYPELLQEETSKKQSTHKRYRTNSIYDRLVQLLFSDMEGCKYRKIILKELKEKGIVFDPPKDNVPPVDGWGYE